MLRKYGKLINLSEVGGQFINFAEIGGNAVSLMHHWLNGNGHPWMLEHIHLGVKFIRPTTVA